MIHTATRNLLTFTRDLKPANIFLGAKDPSRYPEYPRPLVGDFGIAFKTPQNDPNNPRWYNDGAGTVGFKAPEQMRWIRSDNWEPVNEWRLNSKTNVFACGLILWCLVGEERAPPEPDWLGRSDEDTTLELQYEDDDPELVYSRELIDLINHCLSFRPQDRPTFEQMLARILQETDRPSGTISLAKGMRRGSATNARKQLESVLIAPDNYRLAMHRDEIVPE